MKPNFILFQPDELRAESLGCYGHPTSITPNYDRFARQATRFEQAHTSHTVCSQSRAAFMTGWPTHVHGHRTLSYLLHGSEPNLLKTLKRAGYTVVWWGKNDLLARDAWEESVTQRPIKRGDDNGRNPFATDDPRYKTMLRDPPTGGLNGSRDYARVAAAVTWLRTRAVQPFVLFLPLEKPHPPYSCPEPFHSSVSAETLPPLRPRAPRHGREPDYRELIRRYRSLGSVSDAFLRELHAVYLGCVSFSDFLFGLVLRAVDDSPALMASTSVLVFSDHGDYAGDYGLVEKWPSGLEDVLTRVPLLVRTPGGSAGVVSEPIQLFDIVPTLLELAGVPAEHVHFGSSFLPQLHGAPAEVGRAVFAEGGFGTHEPRSHEGYGGMPSEFSDYYPKVAQQQSYPLSVCRAVSVRTAHHKLVLRSDPSVADESLVHELYDLRDDPLELSNLYGEVNMSAITAELRSRLLRWYIQTSDTAPRRMDPRDGDYEWPQPYAARTARTEGAARTARTEDIAVVAVGTMLMLLGCGWTRLRVRRGEVGRRVLSHSGSELSRRA